MSEPQKRGARKPNKPGRPSKYEPDTVAEIIKLLSEGCIVENVCAKTGIGVSTFYDWIIEYPEFSEKVTRAKADALVGAVQSLRTAMLPHDVTSKTVKMFKETRLRKARVNIGTEAKPKYAISEVPYEYTKPEQGQTVTNEFDWRAALEFLRRRDPDNWTERLIIKVEPEQEKVLKELGLSASEAWNQFIQELASAKHASGH